MNSKQKGKRVELEACDLLRSLGYEARRSQQYKGSAGSADIEAPELNLHIEVKGDRSIGLGTKALGEACAQAIRDAGGKPWAVLWKEHRKGWRLTCEFGFLVVTTTEIGDALAFYAVTRGVRPAAGRGRRD